MKTPRPEDVESVVSQPTEFWHVARFGSEIIEKDGVLTIRPARIPRAMFGVIMAMTCLIAMAVIWTNVEEYLVRLAFMSIPVVMFPFIYGGMALFFGVMESSQSFEPFAVINEKEGRIELPRLSADFAFDQIQEVRITSGTWTNPHQADGPPSERWGQHAPYYELSLLVQTEGQATQKVPVFVDLNHNSRVGKIASRLSAMCGCRVTKSHFEWSQRVIWPPVEDTQLFEKFNCQKSPFL